jgi:hypothetical protein
MSTPTRRVARDHTNEWLVVLRVFVLFPALVTVLAMGASAVLTRDTDVEPTLPSMVELAPAAGARSLGDPSYAAPLEGVASASDAAELPNGWVVLDKRAQQLVFLDESAALVRVAARGGEGPGELSGASEIAWVDSLVVVVDAAGRTMDVFGADGAFRSRVPLRDTGCASAPVRELIGGPASVVLLRLCTKRDGSTSALVERVQLAGDRQVLMDRVYHETSSGKLDPMRLPLLAGVGRRLYFVISPDRCVTVLEPAPGQPGSICHPDDNPIALPDSLARVFKELEPRARAVGATLVIPERLPPFTDILAVGGELAFHVLVDEDTHALEIVRDDHLERVILPGRASFAAGSRTLLLARDELEGTAFAVLPLP